MLTKLAAILSLLVSLVAVPARALPAQTEHASVSVQTASKERAARRPVLGTPSEDQRYAALEAASPDAKKYRGGDVIVISASAVAIILLVVLIILLI